MVYWTTAAIQVGFTVISRKQEILNTMTTTHHNCERRIAQSARRMRVARAVVRVGGGGL